MSKEVKPKVTPQSLIKESQVRAALIVDKGSDAELVKWEVVDFTKKGDNYACIVTSVEATYRQGGQEHNISYVVKCNPCRQMAMMNEFVNTVFVKEGGFYEDILPKLNTQLRVAGQEPLRLPQCYHVHVVENEEIIILQDLRPHGFKMRDRQKGLDKAHTSLVLKELGRLHAAGVLLQKKYSQHLKEKYPYLKRDFHTFTENSEEQFKQMFVAHFENAAEMLERIGGYETSVTWLRDHASNTLDMFDGLLQTSSSFHLIGHGDCWNNNILFKYDDSGSPVDVQLVDLQMCRQASPALDLNYLLYTSLNGSDRRDNLTTFLQTYHESFSAVLNEVGEEVPFSSEELRLEYHSKNLFGLMMGAMIVPIVVSEASEVFDVDGIVDDDMDKMIKEYREKQLAQLENNPLLRPRLLAIFDDMLEYGVIS